MAGHESITLPRTMAVDCAAMSSKLSRARVAHQAGPAQQARTTARIMKWRFTQPYCASDRPSDPVEKTGLVQKLTVEVFTCDTVMWPSAPSGADNQHRHRQVVPHRVDGIAEDQVLQPA